MSGNQSHGCSESSYKGKGNSESKKCSLNDKFTKLPTPPLAVFSFHYTLGFVREKENVNISRTLYIKTSKGYTPKDGKINFFYRLVKKEITS